MEDRIQGQPTSHRAIRTELSECSKRLTFIDEHPFTSELLGINVMIIKKPRNLAITKNIGRIFRGHNIIEYKSPMESFTADDYSKAFAYTYFYASQTHISLDDTTITIIASTSARSLLHRLHSDTRLTVEEAGRGIHYVHGERMPVQIIEQKALSETENPWLWALRKDLPKETLERLVDESRQRNDLDVYMSTILATNEKPIKRDANGGNTAK